MLSSNEAYNSSLPNVPGMLTHKDSWVYRKIDGFKKANKPHDSTMLSCRYATASPYDRQNSHPRPATASIIPDRTSTLIPVLEQQHGFHLRESSSGYFMPMMMQTGTFFNSRPQTASSANRRVNTIERTGGLKFQEAQTVPYETRNIANVAPFVETEKVVARFYGYFKFDRIFDLDSVLGPAGVNAADCRYITILFFMEDNTCEIIEKRQLNSGIQGGLFFARGKTMKSCGSPLLIRDLAPGNIVNILGREIFVSDADKFTRDYFRRQLLLVLPPALTGPDPMRLDQSAQQATGLGFQRTNNLSKNNFGVRSSDYLHKKADNEISRRFLDFDGRSLRFICIDAPGSKQASIAPDAQIVINETTGEYELIVEPSTKKFVFEYFLSDSSIEIRIQKGRSNMNLDNWLLLKKCCLPCNWEDVQRGVTPLYFDPSNLRVGSVVDVYSRKFLLLECDQAASEYYRAQGIPQEIVKLVTVEEHIVHEIPRQGDGFLPIGGPEDTLSTVFGQPHVSKMDKKSKSISKSQSRQLRCKIKIMSKSSIDSSRPLQLIFYLADDSLQIYEEVVRNSGIGGGNYLKRGRYINSLPPSGEEPRRFRPTDIFLGNVFCINGQEMQVVNMDLGTLQYCEANASDYPMSDTFKIMLRMEELITRSRLDLRESFMALDSCQEGWLNEAIFVSALDRWGLTAQLNDQELISILRRFQVATSTSSSSSSDRYLYNEMCDLISHIHVSENGQTKSRGLSVDGLHNLLRTLRVKPTQWRRAIRKEGISHDGYITVANLTALLHKCSVFLTKEVKELLRESYSTFPPSSSGEEMKDNGSGAVRQRGVSSSKIVEKYTARVLGVNAKVTSSNLPKGCNLGATRRLLSTHTATAAAGGTSSRVDLRSQLRLTQSLSQSLPRGAAATAGDALLGTMLLSRIESPEVGSTQTALQAAIVHRRQQLMRSVLRSDRQDINSWAEPESVAEDEGDDKTDFINYELLCNDIYVCDWA